MNTITKTMVLEGSRYYKQHLNIINGILPVQLTPMEIEVLSNFMSLEDNIVEDDRFNSLARKRVRESLNLSPGGLGNYLKSMINKGYLHKSGVTGKITISDYVIPDSPIQTYVFQIKNND